MNSLAHFGFLCKFAPFVGLISLSACLHYVKSEAAGFVEICAMWSQKVWLLRRFCNGMQGQNVSVARGSSWLLFLSL